MTDMHRYLVEEVATDFADGHVSRREAMRRLVLLGIEAAIASSMLAACTPSTPPPPMSAPPVPPAPPPPTSASGEPAPPAPVTGLPPSRPTEAITFAGPEGRTLRAGWAAADAPRGGVLVIHENKGLNDHTRNVAGRFAVAGYSAMALDLLSAEGGTESLGDPANATAALGKIAPERFIADMRAGLDELAKRTPGKKLAGIGFCFGGGMMWRLATAKDPRLAAAAPFYGPFPEGASFDGAKTAVLGVFAEDDERVNKTRDAAKAALEAAKLPHQIVTFPGAKHAFFNDTGPRYDAGAATAAWDKVLAWFQAYVG
jgi:carboxymethylenebutenolidase